MRRGAAQAAIGRTGAVVVAARWPDCGASFSFWGGAGGLGCRGVLATHMRSAPAHLELAFQRETISRAKSSSISSTSRLIVRVGSFRGPTRMEKYWSEMEEQIKPLRTWRSSSFGSRS